jgi:type II secretory pathway component PulK
MEGQVPGGGQFDALNQKWAGGRGDTNGALAEIDLSNYEIAPGRTISLKIEDQERKFNLNIAAQDEVILRQALTLIGVDASLVPTIADSIMDWRDPDDDTHLSGTESDQYRTDDPPYFAKNGPFDDLSELLLVRGVSPAMYWGSSGGGSRTVVFNRPASRSRFEEPVYVVGMVDLFTPLSGRLVNVNTASATVLQVMPDIDENIANAIISTRNGIDGAEGTDDDGFRSVQELARVPGLPPTAIQFFQRYFTVRSLMFEVHVTARIDSAKREYVGMLRRNSQRDIQLVSFYWK